jgi:hypothetical protein
MNIRYLVSLHVGGLLRGATGAPDTAKQRQTTTTSELRYSF